jgi:RNA 2',3'-cyclic 3'-phosphodiesterase
MTTLRAFLAVDVGPAARRSLGAAAERLAREVRGREVRFVRPESYHLTLRFLGEIEAACAATLARSVAEAVAGVAPFELRLGEVAPFPSVRRPQVIVATVAPEAPLAALAVAVEAAAVRAGFPPEARPFRPHLTLGRVRDRAHPAVAAAGPLEPAPFRVAEVVLYRSELLPEGALHTPVERMALGGTVPRPNHSEGEVHGEERPAP